MPNIMINDIALPADLHWRDEFNWLSTSHAEYISLTGARIVQRRKPRIGGRPITLTSGSDVALLNRSQLERLYALCESRAPVTLTFADGRSFTVMFNDADNQPIEAVPIQPGKVPAPVDLYTATIKLVKINV